MYISNSYGADYQPWYKRQEDLQNGIELDEGRLEDDKTTIRSDEQKADPTNLTDEEKALLFELKATDAKVRAHEMAHQSGPAAGGGASYSYTRGPDGVMYAVAGEVPVQIKTGSTPQETISNMQDVIATALAPADPSPQDLMVAAKARVIMMKAQQDYAQKQSEEMGAKDPAKATSQYQENSEYTTENSLADIYS